MLEHLEVDEQGLTMPGSPSRTQAGGVSPKDSGMELKVLRNSFSHGLHMIMMIQICMRSTFRVKTTRKKGIDGISLPSTARSDASAHNDEEDSDEEEKEFGGASQFETAVTQNICNWSR